MSYGMDSIDLASSRDRLKGSLDYSKSLQDINYFQTRGDAYTANYVFNRPKSMLRDYKQYSYSQVGSNHFKIYSRNSNGHCYLKGSITRDKMMKMVDRKIQKLRGKDPVQAHLLNQLKSVNVNNEPALVSPREAVPNLQARQPVSQSTSPASPNYGAFQSMLPTYMAADAIASLRFF